MKLQTIFLLGGITLAGTPAQLPTPDDATPRFDVSLKYNTADNRYEVYAQANFTSSRFVLGPSQISVAVPKAVADQPLDIYSETARWTDYSTVYTPEATPELDFHGVHSMGKVVDFRANEPFMLFFFSLKGGYMDGVRLFMNGKDPNSAQKGMMGGDFSNTMQDFQGKEFFKNSLNAVELAQLTIAPSELGDASLTVYPNPITGDAFSVTARQFVPGERLKLHLLTSTGVELYGVEEDVSKLTNYTVRVPKQLSGQAYLYAERVAPKNGQKSFCKKLIVVN